MVSYCNEGDLFCAGGNDTAAALLIHESYVTAYGDDAVKFIVSQAKSSSATTQRAMSTLMLVSSLALGAWLLA
jgi:hypothetical protein